MRNPNRQAQALPNRARRAAVVRALGGLTAMAALFVAPHAAAAQGYPSQQPIRLVVPYPAGGGTDYFARAVSERMSQELGGQRVIVDNRPGAATIIGADTVARAKPDGYTVLL